ncbi:hypothetical protein HY490_04505 [Candidatus Woesearchaeota archaeon]|nr:hypothetical protein [Candidatus Woesearchaeota archaeon]
MSLKAVKVSDENYRWLSTVAGELQQQRQAPVSIDEALNTIRRGKNVSELAGTWKMSEDEAKRIEADLKKTWKQWRIESV